MDVYVYMYLHIYVGIIVRYFFSHFGKFHFFFFFGNKGRSVVLKSDSNHQGRFLNLVMPEPIKSGFLGCR